MNNGDLERLIEIINPLKSGTGAYISYGLGFGPNFYGKSVYEFLNKDKKHERLASKALCPTINNGYLGISMKDKEIYRCFKLLTDQKSKIGKIDENGKIYLDAGLDFSKETLQKKLRGICSKDSCNFQEFCLGGCRSNAYILASIKGENEPEYAGQEICITNLIQNKSVKYK